MRSDALERKITEHYGREAKEDYRRKVGDDPVYDEITWNNTLPFLPRRGWVLDAGGGEGPWSTRIALLTKCNVALLDLTRDSLSVARRELADVGLENRVDVTEGDLRAVPYANESFDFVLAEGDPIGICGNPSLAVSELARVLKQNRHFVAGIDSTFYRVFRALSKGQTLDYVLRFLRTGLSPAEEGSTFDSRSFTPQEFIALLKRHRMELIKIVGKPLGFDPNAYDIFVAALPKGRRAAIFKDASERKKLARILREIYKEPYVAGLGSHLHIVALKRRR